MDFSIIIVSWNVREKVRENLRALLASKGGVTFEVFVVDNGSMDGTAEMIKKEFPTIKLIASQENLGFARANNIALSEAQGDYLLLLNPDMRVEKRTLKNFFDWLEDNKQADIAGAKLVNEHGLLIKHVRRFPNIFDQFLVASKLGHLRPQFLQKYLLNDFDYSRAARVDSIRGSFFCLRRATYEKLGGLDERFFVWFEEVDYCQTARQHGLEVWYTPVAECIDYVGQSFKQQSSRRKQEYFKSSMLKYFAKWHSLPEVLLLWLAWWVGDCLMWLAFWYKKSTGKILVQPKNN